MPIPLYRRIGALRLPYLYAAAAAALLFAGPGLETGGLALVAVGAGIRLWAAGCIEKDRALCAAGPYSAVRHPLYLGSFISALGIFVMIGNLPLAIAFTLGFALFYGCKMAMEEEALGALFPKTYPAYRGAVPAFLPIPFRGLRGLARGFSLRRAVRNGELLSLTWTLLFLVLLLLRFR